MRRFVYLVSLAVLLTLFSASAQVANNGAVPHLVRYTGTLIQSSSSTGLSKTTGVTL